MFDRRPVYPYETSSTKYPDVASTTTRNVNVYRRRRPVNNYFLFGNVNHYFLYDS